MSLSKESFTIGKLREIIRELIKQNLEEASTTSNIDGGEGPPKTPFAFSGKRKKDKKKEKEVATNSTGYSKVNESRVSVAKEGKLEPFAKAAIKQLQNLISFHKKGKNKEARQMTRDVYTQLEYMSTAFKVLGESINEGKYHSYRNDDTLTSRQKIGRSMREVRNKLVELEKVVGMSLRLKNELNVDSRSYWKTTHKALQKISGRLVKLSSKVGEMK